jgi:hypothetical protein
VDDADYTLTQTVKIDGTRGKVTPWYAKAAESSDHLEHDQNTEEATPVEFATKFDGGIKTMTYNDVQFPIRYEMAGSISGMQVDESAKSVTFLLSQAVGGQATIQVPRGLVDAAGDDFVVLVTASSQEQLQYQLLSSTAEYYTLQVELPEGASSLTIIGTAVVPEFGLLAPLVLSLAIIPLILARRSRQF